MSFLHPRVVAEIEAAPHRPSRKPLLASRRGQALVVVLLALLTFVLSLINLGSRDLWLDEATSVHLSRRFFQDFPNLTDINMTLYYAALAAWLAIGGGAENELFLRLPSALAGALTVPVLFGLVRRISGPNAAALAAALLATNAFFIRYAQEARGYSLVTLLATVATWLFLEGLRRRSWRVWAAYAVVSTAALYTHFFVAFVLVAHLSAAPFIIGGPAIRTRLQRMATLFRLRAPVDAVRASALLPSGAVLATIAMGILALPVIAATGDRGTCQIAYLQPPEAMHVSAALRGIAGDATIAGPRDPDLSFLGPAMLVAMAAAVLLALLSAGRRVLPRNALLLVAWVVVPFGAALVVSYFLVPIFAWRYLVVIVPGLAGLMACLVVQIRPAVLRAATALVLLSLGLASVLAWHRQPVAEPWSDVVANVTSRSTLADGIVFMTTSARKPFQYYARQQGSIPDMPIEVGVPKAGCDGEPELSAATAADLGPDHHARLWLVVAHVGEDTANAQLRDAVLARIHANYREVDRTQWIFKPGSQHNIEVRLYETRVPIASSPP